LPNKKMLLKDNPVMAFYEQDKYIEETLESKKD
jgi:hypothetical protein